MRIRIYSDLHKEFAPFKPPTTDADIVVLAGDIDTQVRGVSWANEVFSQPVIYCAGNHEFYKGHIDHTLRKMREVAAPHVHVLETRPRFATKRVFWSQLLGRISHPPETR